MAKKAKSPVRKDNADIVVTIRNSAMQIWLAGLGALSKAQKERSRIFNTLVKEGEAVQERTGKVAGDRIEQVKAAAGDSWSKFEHAYGAQMARVLHAWGVPTKKDLDALSHRCSGARCRDEEAVEADREAALARSRRRERTCPGLLARRTGAAVTPKAHPFPTDGAIS
jgi:poly(hydroxyalkanoate) granule-associated protein